MPMANGLISIVGIGDGKGKHQLNEQLKGLAARVAQAENLIAAQHHVTSRLRELLQPRNPEVAAVAHILNKEASGLDTMIGDVAGKAEAYLKKTLDQALEKFTDPSKLMGALSGMASAAIKQQRDALMNQLNSLMNENPAIKRINAIQYEIEDLLEDFQDSDVTAEIAKLQQEMAQLRNQDAGKTDTFDAIKNALNALMQSNGGGAVNFMDGQKDLVQGMVKSFRLGGDN